MKLSSNTLYIVSTPIGNLEDITLRALQVLKKSDIILCEDTRRSSKLLNHLKIKKQLISYHKFNEKKQLNNIIDHINRGKILSLISDAGTPLLSDPGRLLLNECLIREIKIVPIPGVSSIATAMSVSGFSDKFLFYGFLPKKLNELTKVLDVLSTYEYSQVFFVPALRANFYINEIKKFYSGRRLMIAKEITKIHEEFIRIDLDNFKTLKSPLKGELTFIISNMDLKEKTINEEKIINKAKKYLKKYSLRDTVNLISVAENVNKKEIYQLCLKLKNKNE